MLMPWPTIRKTANNDSISRPNSRQKLPFPGNGKGREIWGLFSRESRETGIPAHLWLKAWSHWDQAKNGSYQKQLEVFLKKDLTTETKREKSFKNWNKQRDQETSTFKKWNYDSLTWFNHQTQRCLCIKMKNRRPNFPSQVPQLYCIHQNRGWGTWLGFPYCFSFRSSSQSEISTSNSEIAEFDRVSCFIQFFVCFTFFVCAPEQDCFTFYNIIRQLCSDQLLQGVPEKGVF